jgi:hypothetical protein
MIPRITMTRWGGQGDGLHDYAGRSLAIEWLGWIIELNLGRARA